MVDRGFSESGEVRPGGNKKNSEQDNTPKVVRTGSQSAIENAIVRDVAPRVLAKVDGGDRSRMNGAKRPDYAEAAPPMIDQLIDCLLRNDAGCVQKLGQAVESGDLSLVEACQQIFIPVAEKLGTLWTDDRLGFVEVTMALSRLQALVQDFAANRGARGIRPRKERRIMLARAPGEDHVFGLVVLGLYFDSAGWEVSGGSDIEAGEPLYRQLHDNNYGVLGLSVGSQANSNTLSGIISHARKSSRNPNLKIAVGGAAIRADRSLCERVGADFFANDADEAIEKAESLVA